MIADDHKIIRDGLRNLLEELPQLTVVGDAENGREALSMARKQKPDVVIMDICMPELNGMEAARQIRIETPESRIIALSMHSDKRYVLGMLKAGVSGYLVKDCAFNELKEAIFAVHKGHTYLSPSIADTVRQSLVDRMDDNDTANIEDLTAREREVLQLIAEGVKTRAIADRMCLSVKTVETYRSSIMQKLNRHSVAELTKFAVREGLTAIE
jgi:DNA-binding NarL/FixJ family response regulator